jgi:hypothetical protein
MASFTIIQKTSIKNYLGYGEVEALGSGQASISYLNSTLARTDFDESYITLVGEVLTKLAAVETAMSSMVGKAKLIKADVLEFNYSGNYKHLIAEGTRLTKQLAGNLGVPVMRNIFLAAGGGNISIRSA